MILTKYSEELRKKTLKEEGYKEGIEEGVELYANLVKILLSSERLKDVERTLSDKAFRDALFKEYKLL